MYERISIQNFRGLKELTIERLAPINILIGNNGSGKSTVLEAMWLHADPLESELVNRVDAFRGLPLWRILEIGRADFPWKHLFYDFETKEPIIFSGKADKRAWTLKLRHITESDRLLPFWEGRPISRDRLDLLESRDLLNPLNVGRASQLILEYNPEQGEPAVMGITSTSDGNFAFTNRPSLVEPVVPALLLPPIAHDSQEMAIRFGSVDRSNKQERVVKFVRTIEPRLRRFSTIPTRSKFIDLYADIGQKELIPVQLMGSGFVQLVNFAISVASLERDGLLLIDEIENGIHYSALESLWKGIWGLHQETGVQIVATTHSQECFEAARAALPPEAFLVHRLERDRQTGKVRVGTLDASMLRGAANMGVEVR